MTLEKKKLTDYLKHAKRLTGTNSLSVLSNIVVSVENKKLHLECTNLRYYFEAEIPFIENGFEIEETCFPKTLFIGVTLFEAVKNCKGKTIEINIINSCLYFNGILLPISDIDYSKFPETNFYRLGKKLTSSGTIDRMNIFERSFQFKSEDETRYFMNGVHFVIVNGKLRFESTDGKIGLVTDPVMGKSEPEINVNYIVRDVSKFISLNMNHFITTDEMIEYSNDIYRLTVGNIDGQFPNIARVMPDLKEYNKLKFDRVVFHTALKKLILELKMKGKIKPYRTRVRLRYDGMSTDDQTSVQCGAPCETGIPQDTEICIALHYLNKILNRDHDFELWISQDDPFRRAVCVVDKTFNTTEVTMPMQMD